MKKALIILLALVLGILVGLFVGTRNALLVEAADVIGNMWLNALRMTVIPLVFTLLIVGIGKAASMARAGRMTARAILFMNSSARLFRPMPLPLLQKMRCCR